MSINEQIKAYKELRKNGQAFFVDNYEDADNIILALEKLKAEEDKHRIDLSSHSEEDILKECIILMHELVSDFQKWYEWVHGEDAVSELDEEERFCVRKSYFSIVKRLFLFHTNHSGGGSTCAKCNHLGIDDWSKDIEFGFELEESEEEE